MASLTICDRCGLPIERTYDPKRIEVRHLNTQVTKPLFDLHDKCIDALQLWLAQERQRFQSERLK